jgi:hypothetical protein
MIRRLRLAPLFLLLYVSAYSQAPQPKPLRVLFIGNSYTYFNNLPEVLAKLAEAGHQKKVESVMQTPGGWRLQDHWDRGEARKAIQGQKWDYVVLQDQSQLGDNHVISGKPRITTDETFHSAAVEMAKAIRDTGAIPVFYLTWAKKAVPEDQAMLNNAYFRAAKETKSIVAPVGVAWADVRSKDPSLELYIEDGSHPTPAGTYLAACVFYATLFGRSPEGLASKIMGTPVNLDTELPVSGKTAVLVDLKAEQARVLQQAAWQASLKLRRNGGFLPQERVPALASQP